MPVEITFTVGGETIKRYITVDEMMQRLLSSFGPHATIEDDEVQAQRILQQQLDDKAKKEKRFITEKEKPCKSS